MIYNIATRNVIDSLTCSKVHLCHFVGYVHFLHSYVHAWMGFFSSHNIYGAMYYIC